MCLISFPLNKIQNIYFLSNSNLPTRPFVISFIHSHNFLEGKTNGVFLLFILLLFTRPRVYIRLSTATKLGAIVAGQTSVKAPERAAFEKYLPNDVHIVSCHSLHGPTVSPFGQPLVFIFFSFFCNCLHFPFRLFLFYGWRLFLFLIAS